MGLLAMMVRPDLVLRITNWSPTAPVSPRTNMLLCTLAISIIFFLVLIFLLRCCVHYCLTSYRSACHPSTILRLFFDYPSTFLRQICIVSHGFRLAYSCM